MVTIYSLDVLRTYHFKFFSFQEIFRGVIFISSNYEGFYLNCLAISKIIAKYITLFFERNYVLYEVHNSQSS